MKVIDGGWVPEDDPIYNGAWMMFSVRKPKQSSDSAPEKKVSREGVDQPKKRARKER